MQYYLRENQDAEVRGPFTVERLTEAITSGKISPDAWASSDIGDGKADLRVWRACDWFPISSIPEVAELLPAKPGEPGQRRRVTLATIASGLLMVVFSLELATSQQRWYWWAASFIALCAVAQAVVSFLRQRREINSHS